MGHEVYVVCYENDFLSEEDHPEYIYTIPVSTPKSASGLAQKVLRAARIATGSVKPILKATETNGYYARLCEIDGAYGIDAIIAMYFPLESVDAMCRFSAKKPHIKTVIYELDSVRDGISTESRISELYNRALESWLERSYKKATSVIIMQSHEKYWRQRFGKKFASKVLISDLPVFLEKEPLEEKQNEYPKLVYSGLLDKRYRSPTYLLEILQELNKRMDLEFSFFSSGDCEEQIEETAKQAPCIKQHGYVAPAELEKWTREADFLVSIGNSLSHSIPSKLIMYLGYGKPIIHFSVQSDDVCNAYLKKYPAALIVDTRQDIEKNIQKVEDFIRSNMGKRCQFDSYAAEFQTNTPGYNCELITKIL